MRKELEKAEQTLRAADNVAGDIAYMLQGRLRKVYSHSTLEALKKELANYNIKTGRWKS